MSDREYDFTILAGASFSRLITWTDADDAAVDLSGYSALLQVRREPRNDVVLLELTDADAITLGGADGTISIDMLAADTEALTFAHGAYDLKLTSGDGTATRLLEGTVTVSPEVSRT